jgi:hypothetical protein
MPEVVISRVVEEAVPALQIKTRWILQVMVLMV